MCGFDNYTAQQVTVILADKHSFVRLFHRDRGYNFKLFMHLAS